MGAICFLLFAVSILFRHGGVRVSLWVGPRPEAAPQPGCNIRAGVFGILPRRGAGLALDAPLIQLMGLLRTPNLVNQPMMVRKKH